MSQQERYLRRRLMLPARFLCVLAVACSVLTTSSLSGALARAQSPDPDAQVYLQQLQPVLADAQTNLGYLQYYLPLGSANDPNDPTWELAQEASDAVQDDADALETLTPPGPLAQVNDALTAALQDAGASADAAIAALSRGDATTGQQQRTALDGAIASLAQAEAALPASDVATPAAP